MFVSVRASSNVTVGSTYPEDQPHVIAMPAVSEMMGKEAPRMVVVLVWEKYSYAIVALGAGAIVLAPYYAQKERPRRRHYSDVGEYPITVVFVEGIDRA